MQKSKSLHSICMLQRNIERHNIKHCKLLGFRPRLLPGQSLSRYIWFTLRIGQLGHRPLVRSTFITFRTPPFPDLATGLSPAPSPSTLQMDYITAKIIHANKKHVSISNFTFKFYLYSTYTLQCSSVVRCIVFTMEQTTEVGYG